MTPPLFLTPRLAAVGELITLDGPEGHHAADVKRLRIGEPIDLTDGAGTLVHGAVCEVRRGAIGVTVHDVIQVAAPSPRLTVVQALARGGRDEQAVEAMTEVGVDHVVGWEAGRNVAHWTDRTQAKWTATTQAAAKQSRRSWWPQVSGPERTTDVAARCRAADLAVVLHESASVPLAGLSMPPAGEVVIVVGPEGGISDDELAALRVAGGNVVRLGNTVLRSSTAGVAALAVICATSRWA